MQLEPLGANRSVLHLSDQTSVLFSYRTPVAAYIPGTGWCRTDHNWSRTTNKHIGQWLPGKATRKPQEFFDTLVSRL